MGLEPESQVRLRCSKIRTKSLTYTGFRSRENFGVTIAGEFSNAINDCGLFVRGVGNGPQFAGDCTVFNNAGNWTDQMKNGFLNFQLASMDALQDWFFWTWKVSSPTAITLSYNADAPSSLRLHQIGNSSVTGTVQAPLWSYQLGLEGGWIPSDPRKALGTCAALGVDTPQFNGTFKPYQTGGAGAGTIVASSTIEFGTFPPTSLAGVPAGQVSLIPTYAASRGPLTLPPQSFTASVTVSTGDGWFDTQDTASFVTAVSGCEYPDAYKQQGSPVPATACGATASLGGVVPTVAATSAAASAVASSAPAAATSSTTGVATSAPLTSATSDPATATTSATSTTTSAPVVPPVRR